MAIKKDDDNKYITQLPSGLWRLQIRCRSLHFDKTFPTQDDARKKRDELTAITENSAKTLKELWVSYSNSVEFSRKSAWTQKTEHTKSKAILECLGNLSLEELSTVRPVHSYIDERTKHISSRTNKKLSDTTIRLELALLGAMARWAVQRRIIDVNFMKGVSRPAQSKRRRRVSSKEHAGLQQALYDPRPLVAEAARFALALRSIGCRPGELAEALIEDLDIHRRNLLLRSTKNGKDRIVHLTDKAADLLDIQCNHHKANASGSLFLFSSNKRGGGCQRYDYSKAADRLRAVGVVEPGWHLHALRREYISAAIENGVELSALRKQTGHSSVVALEIYDQAAATAPAIRKQLDRLESATELETTIGMVMRLTGLSREEAEEILKRKKPSAE